MRTIKPNVNSLEKNHNLSINQSSNKQLQLQKKKSIMQRKFNLYQPQRIVHQSDHCNPHFFNQHDLIIQNILDSQQQMANEIMQNQIKKQTKSAIKLPVINTRLGKNSTEADNLISQSITNQQINENVDNNNQTKKTLNNLSRKNCRNNLKENKIQELVQPEKAESFLKFIQIKSMKPQQKSPIKLIDLSVRDLKIIKNPIQTEVNKKIKITRKSSQKTTLQKVLQKQKTQKNSHINYSIRKQKKVFSITQPVRKKINNTYHDFCYYICLLNKMGRPSTPFGNYKAYVGKGNNSILIKNSLKNRFWWIIVDSDSQVNLHWTQCRDLKFLQNLKCVENQENKKNILNKQPYQIKKIQFNLTKQNNEKQQQLKNYVGIGLNKLLSKEQKKKYTKNCYSVQLPYQQNFKKIINPNKTKIHNHLQFYWHISNKKALYYNLKKYYESIKQNPFNYIPLTFHVQKQGDKQWLNFQKAFTERNQQILKKYGQNKLKKKKQKNLWIVKPGENSNQGCGIQVFDNIQQIKDIIKNKQQRVNKKSRSFIIQKYLMPFLYNKRKFDIRCYVLVTSINKIMKAYWYQQGYIRTSSKQFTIKNLKNRVIHLTNDAVQKKSQEYGKYENGNKISFQDFQKYLDTIFPQKNYKFYSKIYPQMIKQASSTIKSTCMLMDSNNRQFSFQIFGLDYMIDQQFNVWLIQVNTNPCLQLSSPLLARIIPNMIQNVLKIAIDPLFPPPKEYPKTKIMASDLFDSNKFTLIFNSSQQQQILTNLTKDTNLSDIVQSDEDQQNHDQIQ